MSIIPSFFGGRGRITNSVVDPHDLDDMDPLGNLSTFGFLSEHSKEAMATVDARVDWKEIPEAHLFIVDLPGLKKEEVRVEVEDGRLLKISGERSRENEEKNDKWHRIERSSGKFVRRFKLPENMLMDQIKASLENGVLTVTVPKVEVKKPEVISIDISG